MTSKHDEALKVKETRAHTAGEGKKIKSLLDYFNYVCDGIFSLIIL